MVVLVKPTTIVHIWKIYLFISTCSTLCTVTCVKAAAGWKNRSYFLSLTHFQELSQELLCPKPDARREFPSSRVNRR